MLITLLTVSTFMWISGWIRNSSCLCTPFPNVHKMQNKVIMVRIQPRKCWIKWNKMLFSKRDFPMGSIGQKSLFLWSPSCEICTLWPVPLKNWLCLEVHRVLGQGGIWKKIYENFTGDEADRGCAQGDLPWRQRTLFPLLYVLCGSNLLPRTMQEPS